MHQATWLKTFLAINRGQQTGIFIPDTACRRKFLAYFKAFKADPGVCLMVRDGATSKRKSSRILPFRVFNLDVLFCFFCTHIVFAWNSGRGCKKYFPWLRAHAGADGSAASGTQATLLD